MRSPGPYLDAVAATVKRDFTIFVSYRLRVPTQVLSVLFSLTTFYYLSKLVDPSRVGLHGHYFGFAVVGIVATTLLTSALSTSQQIRSELMAGNFERIVISPLGPVLGIVSVIVFPILYASCFAALMLAVAAVVFGVPLETVNIVPALGVGILGAMSLACIGLLFVALLIAAKSAIGVTWVIAGLGLFGGAYFPLRLLPGWIRWLAYVQPFTPTVDLLRHLLIGTATMGAAWIDLLKLAGFTAVLMPLAVIVLGLAVRFSRRRGTLLEF